MEATRLADEAAANDVRARLAEANPEIATLNAQLAPYYSAQQQLGRALESTTTPHYTSAGGIAGGVLGGLAGGLLGHPFLGVGVGAGFGASLARNPYSLLDRAASTAYGAGRALAGAPGTVTVATQATAPRLALDAAEVSTLQRALLPSKRDQDDEERQRQLQEALTTGKALTSPF